MAKQSGLLTKVQIDDSTPTLRDISGDVRSINVSTPRGVQDITALDKAAVERLLLHADGNVQLTGVFNKASNLSHDVFKDVGSTSVNRTVTIDYGDLGAAPVSGDPRLTMEMVLTDYQVNRPTSGELTWSVPAQLADGIAPTWSTVP